MIAIQTNRKLQFPPASVGYVKMEIDLIQNKPSEGIYEVRIIDTCFDNVTATIEVIENGKPVSKSEEVTKILGTHTRLKRYLYSDLVALGTLLNIDFSDNSKTIENINKLIRQGLLLIVQSECQQGISGAGKGMYFSEAQDWEIIEN